MSPAGRRIILLGLNRDGVEARLCWVERTGGELDPTTGAVVGGQRAERSRPIKVLFHEVSAASGYRRFTGIEVGDAVIDFSPEIRLKDHPGCWIVVNGRSYSPKKLSGLPASFLDHISASGSGLQTVCFAPTE